MSRRRAPAAAPQPAPPPWPDPDWSLPDRVHVQASTWRLQTEARRTYHLPPIQRKIVWTAEQQLALVRSVWSGLPVAPLIVWRQPTRRGDVWWLLDGQQRATALGLDVRTVDGERRPAPPTRWDWRTGAWSLDVGEAATLAGLAGSSLARQTRHLPPGQELSNREHGLTRAQDCEITTLVIDAWGPQLDVASVIAAFRALATPGVPWADEQLSEISDSIEGWEVSE